MKDTGKKTLSLPFQMLIGMALGVIAGFLLKENASYISWIGTIFVRLLKMCVYPLVLLSIICGVANVVDIARLKKIGLAFLGYTFVSSALAAVFGIAAMKITRAGQGVNLGVAETGSAVNVWESLIEWFPDNIFSALANGTMVQIIIFAIFFGVILAAFRQTERGQKLYEVIDSLNEVITNMVGQIIKIAPLGVFALVAGMIGTTSLEIVGGVMKMLLAYYIALAALLIVAYPLILKVVGKVSPIQFYKNAFPTMIMAASTCSSAGTLPVTMKTAKERCGVPSDIVNLVCAPAATINMDGAAIEYTCYVLFAAAAL